MVLTAICRQDDYLAALLCLRRRRALTPASFLKRTRLVDQAGFKATWTRWIHDYFEANMSREPHAKYRQFKRFARHSTCSGLFLICLPTHLMAAPSTPPGSLDPTVGP